MLVTGFACVVYECLYTLCIGVHVGLGMRHMCMDVLVYMCMCASLVPRPSPSFPSLAVR